LLLGPVYVPMKTRACSAEERSGAINAKLATTKVPINPADLLPRSNGETNSRSLKCPRGAAERENVPALPWILKFRMFLR